MQRVLSQSASAHVTNDEWVLSAPFVVVALWQQILGALLCVTARGGFGWLRLGPLVPELA